MKRTQAVQERRSAMKKNSSKTTKMRNREATQSDKAQSSKQTRISAVGRSERKQLLRWGGRRVTIGLDLGDRKSRYCVFDGNGYLKEGEVSTDPAAFRALFGAMEPCRIALEVGTHSPWVSALLAELGWREVLVANTREVRAIGKSKRKNDKLDARKLARLAHADPQLLAPIQHRSVK